MNRRSHGPGWNIAHFYFDEILLNQEFPERPALPAVLAFGDCRPLRL